MNLKDYKRELNLIAKQNMTEYDLYSLVMALLREGENIKALSLRDVSRRIKSARGQVFYGLSSIPDLVILDENFDNEHNANKNIDNINQIYGCIEVKKLNHPLPTIHTINEKLQSSLSPEEGQFLGTILWYRKVIYTNGLDWIYYECKYSDDYWKEIKKNVERRIAGKADIHWYKEIDLTKVSIKSDSLMNGTNRSVKQLTIDDINEINWQEFREKLHQINWK